MAGERDLAVQITSDSSLQFPCSFSGQSRQILDIITCRQPKLSDHVPRRRLQIAIVAFRRIVLLRTTKIGIGGYRLGPFEALEASFGFVLGGGVVGGATKEFIGGNGFLVGEFLACILF